MLKIRDGVNLEKAEKIMNNIDEYLKQIFDLAEKNKRIIDKYIKDKE